MVFIKIHLDNLLTPTQYSNFLKTSSPLKLKAYDYIYNILTKGSEEEFTSLMTGTTQGFVLFFRKLISRLSLKSNSPINFGNYHNNNSCVYNYNNCKYFYNSSVYKIPISYKRIKKIVQAVPSLPISLYEKNHQFLLLSFFFRLYNRLIIGEYSQPKEDLKTILSLGVDLMSPIIYYPNYQNIFYDMRDYSYSISFNSITFPIENDTSVKLSQSFDEIIKIAAEQKITFLNFFIINFFKFPSCVLLGKKILKFIVEHNIELNLNEVKALKISSYELQASKREHVSRIAPFFIITNYDTLQLTSEEQEIFKENQWRGIYSNLSNRTMKFNKIKKEIIDIADSLKYISILNERFKSKLRSIISSCQDINEISDPDHSPNNTIISLQSNLEK